MFANLVAHDALGTMRVLFANLHNSWRLARNTPAVADLDLRLLRDVGLPEHIAERALLTQAIVKGFRVAGTTRQLGDYPSRIVPFPYGGGLL